MLESKLEGTFRDIVRRDLRGMTVKLAPTEKGVPDRLVILPGGRIELVELKAEGGRISPAQAHWHARAASLGVSVTVLTGGPEIAAWGRARSEELAAWFEARAAEEQVNRFGEPSTPEQAPGSYDIDEKAWGQATEALERLEGWDGLIPSWKDTSEIVIRSYLRETTGKRDTRLEALWEEYAPLPGYALATTPSESLKQLDPPAHEEPSTPAYEELDREALQRVVEILEVLIIPYEGYRTSDEQTAEIVIRQYDEARTGLEDPKLAQMLREELPDE